MLHQFVIKYNDEPISVQEVHMVGSVLFKVNVPGKKPLVITRALKENADKFWTSVPEGRQREAEKIGPLIENYFRSK